MMPGPGRTVIADLIWEFSALWNSFFSISPAVEGKAVLAQIEKEKKNKINNVYRTIYYLSCSLVLIFLDSS